MSEVKGKLPDQVEVRELVGWGLDEDGYRPHCASHESAARYARNKVLARALFPTSNTSSDPCASRHVPPALETLLVTQSSRVDLHAEMQHLDWSLGLVDLRDLLTFQRRLVFGAATPPNVPAGEDWAALSALSFGPPRPAHFAVISSRAAELLLESDNPDFHLRLQESGPAKTLHGGSPFFEVAEYRGRWFLRDGYHRAYHMLRSRIVHLPAIIIHARTLAELGAVHPWFFPEEILFCPHPPRVTDFLDDTLTIAYTRPRLVKRLRITVQESLTPASTLFHSPAPAGEPS